MKSSLNTRLKNIKSHRITKIIFTLVVVLLVFYVLLDLMNSKPTVGHFKSTEGQQAYVSAYDEVMSSLQPPTETYDVATSWGTVKAYEYKNQAHPDAIPVVLFPGNRAGTPMWIENMPDFIENRTVYAFDALGDAGKSTQTVPLTDAKDVSGWISQTLTELNIKRAHIVGYSFGGGYVADFALTHPEQVATLTLLDPAFALNFPSLPILFWATVSSMEFLPETWRNHGLAQMTGNSTEDASSDDALVRMIRAATSSYVSSLPTPATLSDEDLRRLKMPVYIGLGENSPITKGAEEKAKLIPKGEVKVWKGATHSLPMEVTSELDAELEVFWRSHR